MVAGLGTVMTESLNLPAAQPGSDSPVGTPPPEPTGASPIEVFLFVVPFVLAIVAAIHLGFRLRRRTV